MRTILITDGMDRDGIEQLREQGFQVVNQHFSAAALPKEIPQYDVLVVRSATQVDRGLLDAAKVTGRLQLIVRAGVGVDNIDTAHARRLGISVMNTPLASGAAVAELVIGHLFGLARFIGAANLSMKEGQWLKKEYTGVELGGKTLGLLGFGRNAKETARRAHALGMNIIYTDLLGPATGYDYCQYLEQASVFAQADFISLHIPSMGAPVIGSRELAQMKDGVYLVNCARGDLLDEAALLQALTAGKVAGAALDVFAEEPSPNRALLQHPRVVATPHLGASTREAQTRIGQEIVRLIVGYFSQEVDCGDH